MQRIDNPITRLLGIRSSVFGGAMYPCTSKELVAAVSKAGGMGIIQPLTLEHVWEQELRESIRWIKDQTDNPFGLNVTLEFSKNEHALQMRKWIDIALEEGCTFFVTSLGKPHEIVQIVHDRGGHVYHKVVHSKHAATAADGGVDGLILVNNRAGGHAGDFSSAQLLEDCTSLGLPMVCAGGISTGEQFVKALEEGYQGCLLGTRLIATPECLSHLDYKDAIINATESDIVYTFKVSGIKLSVINTPFVQKVGTDISAIERFLFRFPRAQKLLRQYYHKRALNEFKDSARYGASPRSYLQAGKGVGEIHEILPAQVILDQFMESALEAGLTVEVS